MTPTLGLGHPADAPCIEIMPWDIEPLVVLLIQNHEPLTKDDLDSVWTLVTLDTLFLREGAEGFFHKLESICQRVVSGELTRFDAAQIKSSEFDGYLHRYLGDGAVTPGAKAAAQAYLDFLAANPAFWPPAESLKEPTCL